MLDAHDPFPGVVIDRCWNVVAANAAAGRLVAGLPADAARPADERLPGVPAPRRARRAHGELRRVGAHLLGQLRRSLAVTADPALQALLDEVARYPNVAALAAREPPRPGRSRRCSCPVTLRRRTAASCRCSPR